VPFKDRYGKKLALYNFMVESSQLDFTRIILDTKSKTINSKTNKQTNIRVTMYTKGHFTHETESP
jgi:hypothetical protein